MDDKIIIQLFFERNEHAIAQLEQKYGKLLQRCAYNIVNNAADAEECVNDTYMGTWNSIPPHNPQSLLAYVCKLVKNIAIKRYRYNTAVKRNSNYDVALEELEGVLLSTKDVETEVEEALLTKTIEEFLDTLKQIDRVIFVKRYYFAEPLSQIAADTALTEKHVSVKLSRLRDKLRNYLKERDYVI